MPNTVHHGGGRRGDTPLDGPTLLSVSGCSFRGARNCQALVPAAWAGLIGPYLAGYLARGMPGVAAYR